MMPFDRYKFAEILSVSNILIIFMTVMLLYSFIRDRELIHTNLYFILFLLFILSIISLITSDNVPVAARNEITLLSGILIVILIINICNNDFIYKKFIIKIFQVALFVSIYAIFQSSYFLITGENIFDTGLVKHYDFLPVTYVYQSNALFPSGIILGHYLLLPAVCGITIWSHISKWKHRVLIKTSVILSVIAIFCTMSRGAWIPLILFGLYLIYKKKRKFHKSIRPILLVSFLWGLFITITPTIDFIGRMNPLSTYNRLGIIYSSFNSISNNPFIGRGLGSTVGQYFPNEQYNIFAANANSIGKKLDIDLGKTYGRETHNTFLQVGVDLGIFGLFLYLLLLYMVWKNGINSNNTSNKNILNVLKKGVLIGFAITTICSLFSSLFFVKQTWVIIGLVFAGANISRNSSTLEFQNGHPNIGYLQLREKI